MTDIVLTTFNARWRHASFGLRYLRANLGEFEPRSAIEELTLDTDPADAVERILAHDPQIVGVGVYVWNATQSLGFVRLMRLVAPDVTIVVGGPEVSHEVDDQSICGLADFVVTGEADHAFRELCAAVLAGTPPETRVIAARPPQPDSLALPYRLYDDEDVEHRIVYVEASRGCPFRCEFCLSSLARGVRAFDLERFLSALDDLWNRGVRNFKFVDRTFNLRADTTTAILDFFAERLDDSTFVHFEMIPDRLPDGLRERLRTFPPASLQFEVGIQTFNPDVAKRISRRQKYDEIDDNLAFLRDETGVHIHADLIVGLPGETRESFARGFDHLVALRPQEIQVGILKRLRGTPIVRHDEEFEMVWSPTPPYQLLANRDLDFETMQRFGRFARYWDLVANSGNFRDTLPLFWGDGSAFEAFWSFSDWLWDETQATGGIALKRLLRLVWRWLTKETGRDPSDVGPRLLADYQRPGRPDVPRPLQPYETMVDVDPADVDAPPRQTRHAL
jgi:hypothetical protein